MIKRLAFYLALSTLLIGLPRLGLAASPLEQDEDLRDALRSAEPIAGVSDGDNTQLSKPGYLFTSNLNRLLKSLQQNSGTISIIDRSGNSVIRDAAQVAQELKSSCSADPYDPTTIQRVATKSIREGNDVYLICARSLEGDNSQESHYLAYYDYQDHLANFNELTITKSGSGNPRSDTLTYEIGSLSGIRDNGHRHVGMAAKEFVENAKKHIVKNGSILAGTLVSSLASATN